MQALRLHLSGWVRNLPDGDLETHVEGSSKAVDEYLAWLEKGPPFARVDVINTRSVEPCGYVSFDIED